MVRTRREDILDIECLSDTEGLGGLERGLEVTFSVPGMRRVRRCEWAVDTERAHRSSRESMSSKLGLMWWMMAASAGKY